MSAQENWQPTELKTELVELRPLTESDFEKLYAVASDPLIWEQHPASDRYKKDVFQRFFKKALDSKSAFLILETGSNEIIGSSRFYDYLPQEATVKIGYTFLARKYWGTAVNKSVKTLMINYAFAQGIKNLLFHIGVTNFRSQKAVEKLGAVKIKEFIKEHKGVETSNVEFSINRQDWELIIKRDDAF